MSNAERSSEESPGTKPWWMSRTLIGIAAMLLSQVLKIWKIEILPVEVTDLLTQVLDLGGATLAVWGRVKARHDLTLTQPGGRFNPRAEVRRAEAVGESQAGRPRHGGRVNPREEAVEESQAGRPRHGGYARLPVLAAAVCWIAIALLCVGVMELVASRGEDRTDLVARFPDVTETPDLAKWIKCAPVVDERSFFVRLLDSVRLSLIPKAQVDETGRVQVGISRVEVKGGADF